MAKRLAVVNFKGGVGKTTLALHIGCYLATRNTAAARVLLVDVDHQSSLSIVALDPDPWERACQAGSTVNRIFSTYTQPGIPLPGLEVIVSNPFGRRYPTIDIVPSQFELDDTEIQLAATNLGTGFVSEWRKRTALCKWLHESGADESYDYVIFDCPPATKIVSQNAIAASHAYAVPVIPDAMSTRGVTHFINLVSSRIDALLKDYLHAPGLPKSDIPPTFVPDTELAGIVISMIQPHGPANTGYLNEHWNNMAALRRQWGSSVLEHVIERATGVAESLGAGWPVFNQTGNANVVNRDLPTMFRDVCQELIQDKLGW
jgi:chromosome partitioning protein